MKSQGLSCATGHQSTQTVSDAAADPRNTLRDVYPKECSPIQ